MYGLLGVSVMAADNAIIFGLNFDQITALVSAIIAGVAVGLARASDRRAKAAKETAVRSNEQSLSNQSGVNDNYKALLEMQNRVGEMAVSIAQLRTELSMKDETIRVLEHKVGKVDAMESMIKILQEENQQYKEQLVELKVQLDQANQIIDRRGLN